MTTETATHTLHTSFGEFYGHIAVVPPITKEQYEAGARALHGLHATATVSDVDFERSYVEALEATEFRTLVNSRASLLHKTEIVVEALRSTGLDIEFDGEIHDAQ